MIGLLRKLLRNEYSGSSIRKYILYAIGEIFLVVIGILLALQVNNWNEERILRKKESLYLERLIAEMGQDLATYSSIIEDLHVGIDAAEKLSYVLNDTSSADTLLIKMTNEYFKYASIVPNFSSSRSTFDDLASTGNLEAITNTELRDQIVEHYANIERIQERMRINNEWALLLDGPFQIQNNIMQFESTTAHLFPKMSIAKKAQELRNRKFEYINNAAVHFWVNGDAIELLESLTMNSKELIDEINQNLMRLK